MTVVVVVVVTVVKVEEIVSERRSPSRIRVGLQRGAHSLTTRRDNFPNWITTITIFCRPRRKHKSLFPWLPPWTREGAPFFPFFRWRYATTCQLHFVVLEGTPPPLTLDTNPTHARAFSLLFLLFLLHQLQHPINQIRLYDWFWTSNWLTFFRICVCESFHLKRNHATNNLKRRLKYDSSSFSNTSNYFLDSPAKPANVATAR